MDDGGFQRRETVWGYRFDPDMYRRCSRCNEYECICGDPAFEAWVADELAAQSKQEALMRGDL